jgi:hypothetical protein
MKNDPQKDTWTVESENRELWGHTSGYMTYCRVSHKEGWTKGTKSYSWPFRT